MPNFLTITKETNDYFTFLLNGDIATEIKNTRNDLLTFGDLAHFKTSNGANLIKEQNIPYGNVTIIDGATSLIPTSTDDLFAKLISVGFFDWMDGTGSGGVDRFDDLLDTFKYFGKDGQMVVVDESELKLVTIPVPDVSGLSVFPTPLISFKTLRVKSDASGYEFVDAVNIVTQDIRAGYTETAPSEDVVKAALDNLSDQIVLATTPDATDIVKGKLKLTGDLGGTADLPTVPNKLDKVSGVTPNAQTYVKRADGTQGMLGYSNDFSLNDSGSEIILEIIPNTKQSKGLLSGDSTLAAWAGQNAVASYLISNIDITQGSSLIDISVGGQTILQQKAIWDARSDKNTFDYVIVQVGHNDLADPISTIIGRLQSYVDSINSTKKSTCKVIVGTLTPARKRYDLDVPSGLGYNNWLALNNAIMGVGSTIITGVYFRTNIHTLSIQDFDTVESNINGRLARIYDTGDGIHENNDARIIIANSYKILLNRLNYLNITSTSLPEKYYLNGIKTKDLILSEKVIYGTKEIGVFRISENDSQKELINLQWDVTGLYRGVYTRGNNVYHSVKLGGFNGIATTINYAEFGIDISNVNSDLKVNGTVEATPATLSSELVTLGQLTSVVGTSGTYAPTITNGDNASSSSLNRATYTKNGNVVTVSFQVSVTPTSTTLACNVILTLPVNKTSSLTSIDFGSATAVNGTVLLPSRIQSQNSDSTVNIIFFASSLSPSTVSGIFQYSTTE